MQFRVLGPLDVHAHGEVHRLGSAMQRRLLAALLIEPGKVVTAERLIDLLWASDPPPSARNALQTYVARLRAWLGRWHADGWLTTHGTGYALDIDPAHVDATQFERLLTAAQTGESPTDAVRLLDEALRLWRGPAFPDLADTDAGHGAATRLQELWLAAFQSRIDALLEVGSLEAAVADLEAATREHPWQERLHEQLIRALSRCGRTAEALDHAYEFRRRMADEFGLDPSPRLLVLEHDIRQQIPAVSPAPLPEPPTVRSRLPRPATALIGRDAERARLEDALQHARLTTVTGPGGVGKSRLAIAVADVQGDGLPADRRLCALGPVADSGAIAHVVANAIELAAPGRAMDETAVVEALRTRDMLLVLDNCEHVVDAAAALADAVIRHCPGVVLLATSRERLGVDGEHVFPVAPLAVPSVAPTGHAANVADAPAVQLFVNRAQQVQPAFQLSADNAAAVAEVCRRLDGLPLALELAAARINALDPSDLADRLDERFVLMVAGRRAGDPRHRTLRSVVDWSYNLLDETERHAFRLLSVFGGGFSLSLAERVATASGLARERLPVVLASLVDKSMIVASADTHTTRYTLLETLRAYGRERLVEHGELDNVSRAHAEAMVDLADHTATGLSTEAEAEWGSRLDADVDNLREAHRWACAADPGVALRLSAALHRYGYWRLHREVLAWAETAVGLPSTDGQAALPGALAAAGVAAWMRGDLDAAEQYAQRGLAQPTLTTQVRALLVEVLGDVATFRGHVDIATARFTDATVLAEQSGEAQTSVFNLGSHALACAYGSDTAQAVTLAETTHDKAVQLRNPTALAWAQYVRGEALSSEDPPRALAFLQDSRRLAASVRNEFIAGVADVSIGSLRSRLGDPGEALRHFAALIERWARSNNWTQQWVTLRNLVEALVRLGADEPAVILHAAATTAGTAAPSYGAEAARLHDAVKSARDRLGPEAARAAELFGRGLQATEVVSFALETIRGLETRWQPGTA